LLNRALLAGGDDVDWGFGSSPLIIIARVPSSGARQTAHEWTSDTLRDSSMAWTLKTTPRTRCNRLSRNVAEPFR